VAPYGVEIGDLLRGVQRRGVGWQRGAPCAALVVEDDRVSFGEYGKIAGDALQVDSRATMNGNQCIGATPHGAEEEPGAVWRRHVSLPGRRLGPEGEGKQSEQGGGAGGEASWCAHASWLVRKRAACGVDSCRTLQFSTGNARAQSPRAA
jgi:hypothetical protein